MNKIPLTFEYGTYEAYTRSEKSFGTLFFTTDTHQIFRGEVEYTKSVRTIDALPSEYEGELGVIYIVGDNRVPYIFDGETYIKFTGDLITQNAVTDDNDYPILLAGSRKFDIIDGEQYGVNYSFTATFNPKTSMLKGVVVNKSKCDQHGNVIDKTYANLNTVNDNTNAINVLQDSMTNVASRLTETENNVVNLQNIKYAASDSVGGSALKAIADENGAEIHKTYLPLAGGTMNEDSVININNRSYIDFPYGDGSTTRKLRLGSGFIKHIPPNNSVWASGIVFRTHDDTSAIGYINARGTGDRLDAYYMGNSYDNPIFTIYATDDKLGDAKFLGCVSAKSFMGDGSKLEDISASNISGTIPISNIPIGTSASEVASGNHTHSYLPLSGGTISGNTTNPLTIENNILSDTYIKFKNSQSKSIGVGISGGVLSAFIETDEGVGSSHEILHTANVYSDEFPKGLGEKSIGESNTLSRSDHVHPPYALSEKTNTSSRILVQDDLSNAIPKSPNIIPSSGISSYVSRADHVHPLQESITGNSATSSAVLHNEVIESNSYPILLAGDSIMNLQINGNYTPNYSRNVYINPSTGTIVAKRFTSTDSGKLLLSTTVGGVSTADITIKGLWEYDYLLFQFISNFAIGSVFNTIVPIQYIADNNIFNIACNIPNKSAGSGGTSISGFNTIIKATRSTTTNTMTLTAEDYGLTANLGTINVFKI